MLSSFYYTKLKDKVKDIMLQQKIFDQFKNMMNLSVKINNKQYQRYLKRKENAVYVLKKKTDYEDSMKIDVTKEKIKRKYYTFEKKKHLKRNCEKTREEICVIDKIE